MVLRLIAFMVALCWGNWAWADQNQVGQVLRLQGQAWSGKTALALGDPVEAGAEISTAAAARLEIRFVDGTSLTLGENATMTVDEFVFLPDRGNKANAVLKIASGAFMVVSGRISSLPDKPLKVVTPVATIGIRGTTFWGGSIDLPLNVLVLDGAIYVENQLGRVELPLPGMGTGVTSASSPPNAPTNWPDAKREIALKAVRFD